MSGLVFRPIGSVDGALVVLDTARRAYAGLSRDASYLHLVHPAAVDLVNADGAVIRAAGQLVCTCAGSAYRGTCWRVKEAEAFETGNASPAIWLTDGAPGELVEANGR